MKLAAAVKPAVIAALAVLLLIPVGMIQGLIAERQARSLEAVRGIAEGWGKRQTVGGPFLVVPYKRTRTSVVREVVDGRERERRTEQTSAETLCLPAETVDWAIDARVSEKARGIYHARLYVATAVVRGRFRLPADFGLPATRDRIDWGTPRLVLDIADPGGIRGVSPLSANGETHEFRAGDRAGEGGVHALLPLQPARTQTLDFSFSLELAGSEALAIAPRGSDTSVTMRADWPHPSFLGRFLPVRHEIGAEGFTATWKVSQYAAPGVGSPEALAVSFIEPAGLYQRLERASKYGFLFIGLTFAAFLLIELLRRLALHPIQYALVGLALAIFFLLLTALSEHVAFGLAYAVAALACVGLIAGYLVHILRSARLGLAFGAALGALYAMLYVLLQAEDYSLLGGSLLLFALLAAVMAATRRVDWYRLGAAQPAAA
ncbi:MAG TPA: cell envelope integrity protein CreD [Burkholderiales bacterium]|nr:cell envelope integrity protein CreD [Burkholderiales bacterium]